MTQLTTSPMERSSRLIMVFKSAEEHHLLSFYSYPYFYSYPCPYSSSVLISHMLCVPFRFPCTHSDSPLLSLKSLGIKSRIGEIYWCDCDTGRCDGRGSDTEVHARYSTRSLHSTPLYSSLSPLLSILHSFPGESPGPSP